MILLNMMAAKLLNSSFATDYFHLLYTAYVLTLKQEVPFGKMAKGTRIWQRAVKMQAKDRRLYAN